MSKDKMYDPMNEILILHDKVSVIEKSIMDMSDCITKLATASLNHSQAMLDMLTTISILQRDTIQNQELLIKCQKRIFSEE